MRELGALDGDGRITAEGKSLRALALPPRLARMIVDSHRAGAGAEAAEIAAILTERGLGGDSVDLDHRLDQFRRDRSPRASSARSLAQRWASQVAAERVLRRQAAGDLSTGVMLAFAFPDRVARNRGNGSFVLANGRGAAVEQTSALARAPYIAVAELTGTAAQGRILLAAPIAQEEIELRFADQIESTEEISFDRGAMALAGAAQDERCTRSRCRRRRWRCSPRRRPRGSSPTGLIAAGLDKLPWSKSLKQWRDRVMFLRKAEGESWPDLSDDALAAAARGMAGAGALRQDFAEGGFARRSVGRADGAAAVGIARAARARSADPFRGADRHACWRSITRPSRARPLPCGCRNCSGSTPIPRLPRARCRWCWNCCRRRSGRCR